VLPADLLAHNILLIFTICTRMRMSGDAAALQAANAAAQTEVALRNQHSLAYLHIWSQALRPCVEHCSSHASLHTQVAVAGPCDCSLIAAAAALLLRFCAGHNNCN
jgi:hypothetical protein